MNAPIMPKNAAYVGSPLDFERQTLYELGWYAQQTPNNSETQNVYIL